MEIDGGMSCQTTMRKTNHKLKFAMRETLMEKAWTQETKIADELNVSKSRVIRTC